MSRDLELCEAMFGIDPDAVRANVESTLRTYGGLSLRPSSEGEASGPHRDGMIAKGRADGAIDGQRRIVFVTGTVDPWTELALTEGNGDHPSVSVKGASHHFWTHEVKDSDGEEVARARKEIYDTVMDWLEVPPPSVGADGEGVTATE